MKKVVVVLLAITAILFVCTSSFAQEKPNRVGIGVSLNNETTLYDESSFYHFSTVLGSVNIYLPVRVSSNFRLEPEIGFSRYSISGSDDSEISYTSFSFGTGMFLQKDYEKVDMYYGIRWGIILNFAEVSYDGDGDSENQTNFYLGPALGGEYFFTNHFGMGGEVQFLYVNVGEMDGGESNISAYMIKTKTLLFMRLYF